MASVEQRESQSSGLATFSNTLEIFDTFKSTREDEKDSDEESFHLPMLDCDEDFDSNSNTKDTPPADIHNEETEDDILNKFDTDTPDIDTKLEENILNDTEDTSAKKVELDNGSDTVETENNPPQETAKSPASENREEATSIPASDPQEPTGAPDNNKDEENAEEIEKSETANNDKNIDKYIESNTPEEKKLTAEQDEQANDVQEVEEIGRDKLQKVDSALSTGNVDLDESEDVVKEQKTVDEDLKTSENDEMMEVDNVIDNDKSDKVVNDSEKSEREVVNDIEKSDKEVVNESEKSDKEVVDDSEKSDKEVVDDSEKSDKEVVDDSEKTIKVVDDSEKTVKEVVDDSEKSDKEVVDDSEKSDKEVVDDSEKSDKEVVDDSEKSDKVVDDSEKTVKEVVNDSEKTVQEVVNDSEKSLVDGSEKYDKEVVDDCVDNIVDNEKSEMDVVKDNVDNLGDNEKSEMDVVKDNDNLGDNEKSEMDVVNDNVDNLGDMDTTAMEVDDSADNVGSEKSKSANELAEDADKTDNKETVAQTETTTSSDSKPKEVDDDSNKSDNLQCEDLLDISVIRDVDEDNASAIAENFNSNDAHSSEKSDNDDPDYEKGEDDSEIEQEDEKDDNMEFDEGNSSNFGDDTLKDDTDMDSNSGHKTLEKSSRDKPKTTDAANNAATKIVDQTDSECTSESNLDESRKVIKEAKEDRLQSQEEAIQNKRPLTTDGDDESEASPKKMRLSASPAIEKQGMANKDDKIKTLVTFKDYMKTKKVSTKLTRSDLEQFCLQKICEAIMHRTDVGELHQTIKKQEQIIDSLRKDLQQLTKQTRDLDIVNKKLMTELRVQNGSKKPLVPLKITRSVGLQVKLNIGTDANARRKQLSTNAVSSPKTTTPTPPASRPRSITPANNSVVRQVASSPRKPAQSPQTTPILSQALQQQQQQQQNRQNTPAPVQKRTQVRHKTPEAAKPANPGVIDLTDEDDKASKNAATATKNASTPFKAMNKVPQKTISIVQTKQVPNKSNGQTKTTAVSQVKTISKLGTPTRTVQALPQGVRLTPTQVKNGIAIPTSMLNPTSGATTQLMYVVQPSSLVTSTAGGNQKALLLNFQPSNGVLTSTLNSSAVSVIPKSTNAVQLKAVLPRKHPAPLPLAAPAPTNMSLKPLLPKPHLSIRKTDTGIILQWRMPYNLDMYEGIASYQLFAYQETNAPPSTDMWRKVGDVKALALPMACTLTQFADKNKYYFAVRSVDIHKRLGAFSDPEEISL